MTTPGRMRYDYFVSDLVDGVAEVCAAPAGSDHLPVIGIVRLEDTRLVARPLSGPPLGSFDSLDDAARALVRSLPGFRATG